MTALATGKQFAELSDPEFMEVPQKGSTVIYKGATVMLDTSGYGHPAGASTTAVCIGVYDDPREALDRSDSTGLSDGVKKITVKAGVFARKNDTGSPVLATTQPGTMLFAVDDQTVSLSDGGGTRVPCGRLYKYDANAQNGPVLVEMSLAIGFELLTLTTVTDPAAAHLAGSETFTGVKTFASGADPLFAKEAAHTLKVADSTTAATAGGALTILAGKSGTSGAGGALALAGGAAAAGGGGNGGAASLDTGAKDGAGSDATLSLGATNAGAITFGRAGKLITRQGPTAAGAATDVIADPGTGAAIPVTQNGVCMITTAAAETNTLAIPTFVGQELCLIMDTRVGGDRVVTSAQAINQAGNTIMTFGAAGDMIVLRAMKVGGALRWRVVANDGVALS